MVSTKISQKKEVMKKIQSSIKAAYVRVYAAPLSKRDITIDISIDKKSKWANGYIQNSRYAIFMTNGDKLENLIRINGKTFRKSKVNDAEAVILKINKYLSQFNK